MLLLEDANAQLTQKPRFIVDILKMNKTVTMEAAWSGEADCKTCALRDSVLFAGLDEKDFEHIHKPIDQMDYRPGTLLYRAGDPATHMFTIRSGLVKLVQYLPDGTQRIVRLLRTSDITGLEGILGENYQHDAIIMQKTEVCALPVEVVKKLSSENAKLHQELMNRWQRALNEADLWITQLSTGSAKQRVARLLLRLVCRDESRQCELFNREDMGAMLGITTETASRTIAEFKRGGMISEITHTNFTIDREKLEAAAGD